MCHVHVAPLCGEGAGQLHLIDAALDVTHAHTAGHEALTMVSLERMGYAIWCGWCDALRTGVNACDRCGSHYLDALRSGTDPLPFTSVFYAKRGYCHAH
jgi:hypothetical protein